MPPGGYPAQPQNVQISLHNHAQYQASNRHQSPPYTHSQHPHRPVQQQKRSGVTGACLINLVDGLGTKQGRILIFTTNRINSIDERLRRPGRMCPPSYFGYSDKDTAAQTFRRIFGTYPINPPTGEKLERLAKRFGDQCPTSFLTPAALQEYCISHRGKPEEAVDSFKEWIQERRTGKKQALYDMDDNILEAEFSDDEDDGDDTKSPMMKML